MEGESKKEQPQTGGMEEAFIQAFIQEFRPGSKSRQLIWFGQNVACIRHQPHLMAAQC